MAAKGKHIGRALLLLLAGAGLFLAVFHHVSLDGIGKLRNISPWPVALAVALTGVMISIVATRWRVLVLATGGETVAWSRFLRCCATTALLGRLVPKDLADIGGRAYWLRRTGTRDGLAAGGSVVIDRICDVIVLVCLLPWSLLAVTGLWTGSEAMVGACMTLLCAISLTSLFREAVFKLIVGAVNGSVRALRHLPLLSKFSPGELVLQVPGSRPLLISMALSVAKPVVMGGQYVLYAQAFSLGLPDQVLLAGIPICQASFMFSFTAGGLGILEAGWLGIFALAGVSGPDVGAFLLGQRLLDILCVALTAAGVHIALALRVRRPV